MILDSRGKLFGKISIIDIIVVIVIIILLGGIYVKFIRTESSQTALVDNIEFSVMVKGVRQPTVDAVILGEKAFEENTNIYIGEVVKKEVLPATDYIEKSDGTIVLAEMPDKYDLIITINVKGIENDIGYFANGNKEIKRGSDLKVKSKMFAVESEVLDVKTVD